MHEFHMLLLELHTWRVDCMGTFCAALVSRQLDFYVLLLLEHYGLLLDLQISWLECHIAVLQLCILQLELHILPA